MKKVKVNTEVICVTEGDVNKVTKILEKAGYGYGWIDVPPGWTPLKEKDWGNRDINNHNLGICIWKNDKTLSYEWVELDKTLDDLKHEAEEEEDAWTFMYATEFLATYDDDITNLNYSFKKEDLENWMVVKTRNGKLYIIDKDSSTLIQPKGYNFLSDYDNDLNYHQSNNNYDIVEVYKPTNAVLNIFDIFRMDKGEHFLHAPRFFTLIWERRDPVVEMTLEEVKEKLGIKNLKITD